MAVGMIKTWKKVNHYYLPFNIKVVGKNIKWGKGTEVLWNKIKIINVWG